MQKIIGTVTKAPAQLSNDDDFADRLSHRYTVLIMVVFAFVVSTALYVGAPITCWAPKHFTGSHTKYANSYCWVKNTYYLPYEEEIPKEHEGDKRQTIIYYQWMPFIMLAQALFFYLPSALWHGLNQKDGVDCDNILSAAQKYQNIFNDKGRKVTLKHIGAQLDRFLGARSKTQRSAISQKLILCGAKMGNYLVLVYLASKVLYIANAIGQLFVLNSILKTNYSLFGYQFITDVYHNEAWTPTLAFPRVTFCDFLVRRLGNEHRYTVQCTLPLNMYTEKIYAFLWFWYLFIACMSCLSFVLWVLRVLVPNDRVHYIKNHLHLDGEKPDDDEIDEFTRSYLKQDGVFIIRLIGHNTNNITATEVTGHMWGLWKEKHHTPKNEDGEEMQPLAPPSGTPPGVYPNLDEPEPEKKPL